MFSLEHQAKQWRTQHQPVAEEALEADLEAEVVDVAEDVDEAEVVVEAVALKMLIKSGSQLLNLVV